MFEVPCPNANQQSKTAIASKSEANRRRMIRDSVDCVAFRGYLGGRGCRFSISSLRFAMPIYEYKCNKCGVFEAMQGIKEAPLKKCPTCKSKVERQMSRGSFILKGSGWYATDYAKKSTPSSPESDSSSTPATPATNGSTASSSDTSSKPASESRPATESKPSSSESKTSSRSKSSSEKSVSAKAAD